MSNRSQQLFEQSQQSIPGGVNSPVRAYQAVGGTPPFIDRAKGCYLTDVDGKQYIDYVMSWGAMIAGHANEVVLQAVRDTLAKGLSFGAPTQLEMQLAEQVCQLVPNMDQIRMVNSGTEATMSAIRLARGVTGRDLIVKFEGCYHGHSDSLLVKSGSGALTMGVPTSPGVSPALAAQTMTLTYNDSEGCRQLFAEKGDQIAAIIVEPVAGNMNCVPPVDGFLETLRSVCDQSGALLIFDEVMTGFRVAKGGAQALYQIDADIITFGKVIGGGMPVGAYGGRRELMQQIAPAGPIYQAGTLSGNPVAMAAGLANMQIIQQSGFYENLQDMTNRLMVGIQAAADQHKIPFSTNHVGSMMGLFFTNESKVTCFDQVMGCDIQRFNQFFHGMLSRGVYLAPAAYEAGFLSMAHTPEVVDQTIEIAEQVFAEMAQ